MLWISLAIWIADTLADVEYQWAGFYEKGPETCAQVHVQATTRPLLLLWQESLTGNDWVTIQRVRIDRWNVPKDYTICSKGGKQGIRVRVILTGVSAQSPKAILYDGYPWGEPPLPSDISLEPGQPSILQVNITAAGNYLLRAFNRFGEEVFTIPVELPTPQKLSFTIPQVLKGPHLVQLYSLSYGRLIAEKLIQL
ncbi:MAG: hypothetical protein N3E49_08070 [Bacteroidia bacterium]|nr:hypothetical protein [Bacteroidia bacterium]